MSATRQQSNTRFLFHFTALFQQQLFPHTRNPKSHLSPGCSPRSVTMWHHSRLRWLCTTVLSFHQFPAPFLIPCITTILAQRVCMVWHFPLKRMENIFLICPVAPISSGPVQLNADLDQASSLSDSYNNSREQQCLPSLGAKPKKDHHYAFPLTSYLRSLLLKLWNLYSPATFLNRMKLTTEGPNTMRWERECLSPWRTQHAFQQ